MSKNSMIYGQLLDFDELINRLTELQKRINTVRMSLFCQIRK